MSRRHRKQKRESETINSQPTKSPIVVAKTEKMTPLKITGWRLWVFRLMAAVLIPVLLILGLEFGLRFTGYGFDPSAIIRCQVKGKKAYCDNIKFSWLFFPPRIARESNPFVMSAEKPENSYRIFIFGASAAQGVPDSAYSFSRILGIMLAEQYPGVNFEVINTAITATNSHVVVSMAEDCAKHEPDLCIVYLGNNEVIGPYGAGTVFAPIMKNLSLIRFGIALRGTRLGQLMTNVLQGGRKDVPKVWGGMSMFVDKQVSASDEELQIVYENYGRNLETIIKTARKGKAAVILATVGSNIKDCPPFASLHRSDITNAEQKRFEQLYQEGIALEASGQDAQALEKYLSCVDIDDQFAELHFRLGRLYFHLDRYQQAKQQYVIARELDTVRLRADSHINEIIKENTGVDLEGVYLADAVKALEQQSPYQIPGNELFHEHVHLNFTGNYILAKTIFEQVEKTLPTGIKSRKVSGQPVIDEEQCKASLAYSDWDEYTIMQSLLNEYMIHAPFTNQMDHDQQVKRLEGYIQALKHNLSEEVLLRVDKAYETAIESRPADWVLHWKYGKLLMDGRQDYRKALEEYEKVLELVPHYYMANVMLGTLWGRLDDYDEAQRNFEQALKIKPYYAPAYYDLGLLCQKRGNIKEAKRKYKTALSINPEHYPSYMNLGFLFYQEGRLDEAMEVYCEGLKFLPDSVNLHYNLGCILREKGQKEEAIKKFRTVLEINPGHRLAKQDLEAMLKESGQ